MGSLAKRPFGRYFLITLGTLIMTAGTYYFRFPNNFVFGGVTGVAVVLGELTPFSPSVVTFALNMALLLVGFLFLGRGFGVMTVYSSVLMSVALWLLERVHPLTAPLTNQPMLEFIIAIFLPGFGSALLFNVGASSGGTDILALILKKHTGYNEGTALLMVDCVIVAASFLVFDITTGIFAATGLFTKTFAINTTIENFNLSKYFNVICDNPEPICKFINEELNRGATVCQGQGAFTHSKKAIVFTALGRSQAVRLRNYVKTVEPGAFIMITNSSEIIGKGFQSS